MEDKADYSDRRIIRGNDYLFMWQIKGFSWSEVIYVITWNNIEESK